LSLEGNNLFKEI